MTLTPPSYSYLKEQVIFNVGLIDTQDNLLDQMKQFYKSEIDSNRRYEVIQTIGQLLHVLEIRDVLSEDKVTPLKEIASRINNTELLKKICDYEVSYVQGEHLNIYGVKKPIVSNKEPEISLPSGHPYGSITARKKNRINSTILEEIGTSWRDLARNLKLQEYRIDEIDKIKETDREKAKETLNVYEDKADPQRGFLILCEALEKTRRKDLCRKIQEIMMGEVTRSHP